MGERVILGTLQISLKKSTWTLALLNVEGAVQWFLAKILSEEIFLPLEKAEKTVISL